MPRPRFSKLEPDKQRRILDAAADALIQHGYEGASLNQIIAEAGISKGAVYYYFDDKADLVATVMLDAWKRLMSFDDVDPEALSAEGFWPDIQAWALAALAKMEGEPRIIGLGKLFYRIPHDAFAGTVLADLLEEAKRLLERLVCRGQELGVIRDDLPLGLLLAMVAGLGEASDRWMAEHWEQFDPEQGLAATLGLFDMMRAMLAPPAPASA